jgi:hypothetical protein
VDKIITSFVGLDVHKDSIAMGVAPAGREPPRFVGTVVPQWLPLCKALGRLGRARELQIVYEAGPCGYPLARQLRPRGVREPHQGSATRSVCRSTLGRDLPRQPVASVARLGRLRADARAAPCRT